MIVFCEECGKKYRIDPAKIKGTAASFKCRSCSHRIVVPAGMVRNLCPGTEKVRYYSLTMANLSSISDYGISAMEYGAGVKIVDIDKASWSKKMENAHD